MFLPVAIGGTNPKEENHKQRGQAHSSGNVLLLHLHHMLLFPPLQVTELTALSQVAFCTTAQ